MVQWALIWVGTVQTVHPGLQPIKAALFRSARSSAAPQGEAGAELLNGSWGGGCNRGRGPNVATLSIPRTYGPGGRGGAGSQWSVRKLSIKLPQLMAQLHKHHIPFYTCLTRHIKPWPFQNGVQVLGLWAIRAFIWLYACTLNQCFSFFKVTPCRHLLDRIGLLCQEAPWSKDRVVDGGFCWKPPWWAVSTYMQY